MLDKLKSISPILIVVLLLSQGFVAWTANEAKAKAKAKAANWQAMQATNAANRAYASAANAHGQVRHLQNSVSSIALCRKGGSSG